MARRRAVGVSLVRSFLLTVAVAATLVVARDAIAQSLSAALRIPAPDPGTTFGASLAAKDGKVIVGYGFGLTDTGVIVYDATSGGILLVIPNPTNDVTDQFGGSVAWVGDDILVGAPLADADGPDRGLAYVFDGVDGTLLHTLHRPDNVVGWFGYSVAGLGDDAVVGVSGLLGPNGEGAYIFDGATGGLLVSLKSPHANTTSAGRFGTTVITAGGEVFVSETFGASEIHRFDASGTLLTTYADPEPGDSDDFGEALAVSGTHLAVGIGAQNGDGKTYLYDVATGALEHTFAPPFFSDSLNFGLSLGGGVPGAIGIGSNNGVFLYATSPPYDLLTRLFAPGAFADDHDAFGREQAPLGDGGLVVGATGKTYVFDLCGNGTRTAREQCDDGNGVDGDGCSATCQLETCGSAPAAGCVMASKSSIALRDENSLYGIKDSLKWTWAGPATALALFGDPLTTADFSLCVYDHANGPMPPRLRMAPAMLAGGLCLGKPCWKTKDTKFSYADKDHTPSGVERFTLGTSSVTKALVIGKGTDLLVPAAEFGQIPLDGQVTVQLRSRTSVTCLQADFPMPASADAKGVYKDKMP
jgi:cysteine-rich repeat protein